MYIFSIIIFILYLNLNTFFKKFNANYKFNSFHSNYFFKFNFFIYIASLVGIPPLFGFFNKFIIFLNLVFFYKNIFFVFFLIFNVFLMVFYLNQFRYTQSNFKKISFFKKKNINLFLFSFIIFSQYINIFAIIFLPFFLFLFFF